MALQPNIPPQELGFGIKIYFLSLNPKGRGTKLRALNPRSARIGTVGPPLHFAGPSLKCWARNENYKIKLPSFTDGYFLFNTKVFT